MNQIERYIIQCIQHIKGLSFKDILAWIGYVIKKTKWLLLLLIALILLQLYRHRLHLVTHQGEALGKPLHMQYWTKNPKNYQPKIDTLLADLAQAISIDDENAAIYRFNHHDCRAFHLEKPYLYHLLDKSKAIYKVTVGAFDPTVAPLVKLWRKHLDKGTQPSIQKINALLEYVKLDYVVANPKRVKRLKEGVTLDVQGLLHGYIIDTIAGLLKEQGIANMLIKVDKEAVAYGNPHKKQGWLIQESLTTFYPDSMHTINVEVILRNQGMAIKQRYYGAAADNESSQHEALSTQNNEVFTQKCALIIDPATGYLAQNELLAVVVLAQDGTSADAYATAMMAKGIGFAQNLANEQKDVEVLMVYQDNKGNILYYTSEGLHMEQDDDNQTIKLMPQENSTTNTP